MANDTFQEVAQNIIDESIKSAVFIDDEIPNLFSGVEDNTGICKTLYESFQTKGCSVDFFNFKSPNDIKKRLLFERKDLVILDWELDSVEPKYKSTLEIIDSAVETDNLHFVCIYSQKGDDYCDIFYKILAYYSCNNIDSKEDKIKNIVNFIEEEGLDEDAIADIIEIIKEEAKKRTLNQISDRDFKKKLIDEIGLRYRNFKELVENLYNPIKPFCSFVKLGFDLNQTEIYRSNPKDVYINCKNNYLQVNNTFFSVFKKGETAPDQLYNKFSLAIASANEAFLTFMSLELRNKLLSKSSLIGKELSKVNESAFFHHKNTISPDEAFDNFIVELWENYNISWLYKEKSGLLAVIDNYFDNKEKSTPSDEDLAKLNYYYNIDHTVATTNRNIEYGDIFMIEQDGHNDSFLLCITPHCDCLRPKKIRGYYFFVNGKKIKNSRGLDLGDSGFTSFIKNSNGDFVCVEWELKPYTLYFCENQRNISNPTSIVYGEDIVDLKYCCTLKENYCQRITNQSFSYPIRVGISFAKKEIEDECQKFRDGKCQHINE